MPGIDDDDNKSVVDYIFDESTIQCDKSFIFTFSLKEYSLAQHAFNENDYTSLQS